MQGEREGSLDAPERHPLAWRDADFYDEEKVLAEQERVFEICHGCRRCFSLCHAFPTLFDLIDESATMELDGVAKADFRRVVDQCYLCDMCFMTKCPYVPPHPWNVDFPKLMLRAKAVRRRKEGVRTRDRVLSSTDAVGRLATTPVTAPVVNACNCNAAFRGALESAFGVHRDAALPRYASPTARRRLSSGRLDPSRAEATDASRGRVALFLTCYGNYNEPRICEDLVAVYEHNGIPVRLTRSERCCGMPKLELGDLDAVARLKETNVAELARLVDEGWDIVAPIPSCVLMFKQELPLMFPDDEDVIRVRDAIFDPFEYLSLRHKAGKLDTEFPNALGRIAYHVACHQRVQNIGARTREVLALVPDTKVTAIERCSGHDGTYAVKVEFHETAMKIGRPVTRRVKEASPDHYTSDCMMAARHIEHGLAADAPQGKAPEHPMSLVRRAYGI